MYYNSWVEAQDRYRLSTNWDLYNKWTAVKTNASRINNMWGNDGSGTISKFQFNYLSACCGSFPYFVASGHSSPQEGAPRLYTGHLDSNSASNRKWPDFPRRACKWWFWGGELCSVDFEGINRLFYDKILWGGLRVKFTGVVMMDFPGGDLISSIIGRNLACGMPCTLLLSLCHALSSKAKFSRNADIPRIEKGDSSKTYNDAKSYCKNKRMELVSIHGAVENAFASKACGNSNCWIGGNSINRKEFDFVWFDGSEWDYTNWSPGEPNNWGSTDEECVEMRPDGKWNDNACTRKFPPLCGLFLFDPTLIRCEHIVRLLDQRGS